MAWLQQAGMPVVCGLVGFLAWGHWNDLKFFLRKIKCGGLWHTTHLLSKFFPNPKEAPATVEAKLFASPEEPCAHLYAVRTGNTYSGGLDVRNEN